MPAVPQALRVFVSAAESGEDEALWRKLEAQLAILGKQGLIEIWDKGDIAAGADRTRAADTRLAAADIIVLLISPDFLASDYVGGVELKRAMDGMRRGRHLWSQSFCGPVCGSMVTLPSCRRCRPMASR
jgi:hypothetical protein